MNYSKTIALLLLTLLCALDGHGFNDDIDWGDMPVLFISTVDGAVPTCTVVSAPAGCIGTSITDNNYVPGRMVMVLRGDTLYDSKEYVKDKSGMKIKIRGNSTGASLDQHPYKIKLTKKYDLLRRQDNACKHKKWLLLSMYTWNPKCTNGQSNVLNIAGFLVSKGLKKEWTPEYDFVHVCLNGQYQGMYYLTESVEKGDARVNISNEGFLIENDPFWWNEDVYFKTKRQIQELGYTFKYPDSDDVNDSIQGVIKDYMDEIEDCLYGQGNLSENINVESFAKWILIHDVLGTDDTAGCNKFLSRYDMNPGSKLLMGPVWDYDSMFRSDGLSTLHYSQQWFYYPLFFERAEFKDVYCSLWNQLKPSLIETLQSGLSAAKDKYGETFDKGMAIHQTLYPNEGRQSFNSQIDEVMEKLMKRIEMVDQIISENISSISTNEVSNKASLVGIADYLGNYYQTDRFNRLPKGVYILKYSDGSVRKTLKKE